METIRVIDRSIWRNGAIGGAIARLQKNETAQSLHIVQVGSGTRLG